MEECPLDTINAVLMVVLVIILAVTLYVEFKYMRHRRKDDIVKVLDRDEAYNTLTNTNAVSLSLRNIGKDTSHADLLLEKAKFEYDRKDYAKVIVTTKMAREALMGAKDEDLLLESVSEEEFLVDGPGPVVDEDKTTVSEVKKLPQNYLESKFLITSVQSEIDTARDTKDVSIAERFLGDARKSFDAADYNAALTNSMKARRNLEGITTVPTAEPTAKEMEEVHTAMKESVLMVEGCSKCGAEMGKDDEFCGSCGDKVGRPTICPQCRAPIKPKDTFCRKCGKKLS